MRLSLLVSLDLLLVLLRSCTNIAPGTDSCQCHCCDGIETFWIVATSGLWQFPSIMMQLGYLFFWLWQRKVGCLLGQSISFISVVFKLNHPNHFRYKKSSTR